MTTKLQTSLRPLGVVVSALAISLLVAQSVSAGGVGGNSTYLPIVSGSSGTTAMPTAVPTAIPTVNPTKVPNPGTPQTYYASPTGNDSKSGLNEQNAWATFNRAWRSLYPGDTLILLDGVYHQSLNPNTRNGKPGQYITVKAKNDGKAIIEGDNQRTPILLGNTWTGESGENPVGNYFDIEGIVARNSNDMVVYLYGSNHNILRRVSAYNANTDTNSAVFTIGAPSAQYNLIEDCVASGTGRKMILMFQAGHNTIRRCFANWQSWDGRQRHEYWPWGDNIQIYNASNDIIENSIGYGPVSFWNISIQANDPSIVATDNKVLGSIAVHAGMNADNTLKWWGSCSDKPDPCKTTDRPQPTTYSSLLNFDWGGHRAGFELYGSGKLANNLFQDILAYNNAGPGFWYTAGGVAFNSQNANNQVNRATIYNNGADNRCGGWPCTMGGPQTDALANQLSLLSVSNSRIQNIFVSWPGYPNQPRNLSSLNGEGARLTHRYIDGVLMDGSNGQPAQLLWPWPMEDRIKAELGISITSEMSKIISGQ